MTIRKLNPNKNFADKIFVNLEFNGMSGTDIAEKLLNNEISSKEIATWFEGIINVFRKNIAGVFDIFDSLGIQDGPNHAPSFIIGLFRNALNSQFEILAENNPLITQKIRYNLIDFLEEYIRENIKTNHSLTLTKKTLEEDKDIYYDLLFNLFNRILLSPKLKELQDAYYSEEFLSHTQQRSLKNLKKELQKRPDLAVLRDTGVLDSFIKLDIQEIESSHGFENILEFILADIEKNEASEHSEVAK